MNFTFMLPYIAIDFLLNNQPDALIIQIYSLIQGEHKVFPWLQTLQENYVEYKVFFF
jgi:hypothetical protein